METASQDRVRLSVRLRLKGSGQITATAREPRRLRDDGRTNSPLEALDQRTQFVLKRQLSSQIPVFSEPGTQI